MPKSAITISLVPEARGGPFVFWDDFERACSEASRIGLDAVEVFAPDGETIRQLPIKTVLEYPLQIAAFGTGAGMVKYGLSLSHSDTSHRQRAQQFVRSMIHAAATWNAPVIVGSMQGRWTAECDCARALAFLRDSLNQLGQAAYDLGISLFFEPLNRYETNMVNTIDDAVALIQSLDVRNVKLLVDLFHANIEEPNIAGSLIEALPYIGHIHLADSNRRAAGYGHIDYQPIADAICAGGYQGYLSAEVLPLPDSVSAAEMTMQTFRKFFSTT
ncbi:MAG: sugar phosphate isomerase/epimerase [Pirellulaceae bacterium]|nr:sugar phosphate isomerase/epimerase [Pirellulaceae bacterium]